MKITYWTSFSKRKNSTKVPTSGTEIDVTLKIGTSLEAPTFILSLSNAFDIVYVKAFDHYYFVTDINYVHNQTFEVVCSQDVLATYKSQIGSTTALVARSTSNFNKYIKDDMISTLTTYVAEDTSPYTFPFDEDGCFILSCVNNDTPGKGYVTNYVLTAGQFTSLAVWMSGGGNYGPDTFDDVIAFMVTNVSDVLGCIRGVKWIPVPYDTVKGIGTSRNIHLGKYDTNISAYRIDGDGLIHDGGSMTFSQILPDDFRSAYPYSSVDVFIPYYGIVSLPPQYCVNGVQYTYYVDVINGECYVRLYSMGSDTAKLLSSVSFNIGVETPIAQAGRSAGAAIDAAMGAVGSLASGNPLMAMTQGVGVISAFAQSGISSKGSQGGRAMAHYNEIVAYATTQATTVPEDLASVQGRPLMAVVQLSSLSGYIQCIGASVSISGPGEDRDQINAYLNGGFFYE